MDRTNSTRLLRHNIQKQCGDYLDYRMDRFHSTRSLVTSLCQKHEYFRLSNRMICMDTMAQPNYIWQSAEISGLHITILYWRWWSCAVHQEQEWSPRKQVHSRLSNHTLSQSVRKQVKSRRAFDLWVEGSVQRTPDQLERQREFDPVIHQSSLHLKEPSSCPLSELTYKRSIGSITSISMHCRYSTTSSLNDSRR